MITRTLYYNEGTKTTIHKGCCEFIQEENESKASILLMNFNEEHRKKLNGIINFINNLFGEGTVTKKPFKKTFSGKITNKKNSEINAIFTYFGKFNFKQSIEKYVTVEEPLFNLSNKNSIIGIIKKKNNGLYGANYHYYIIKLNGTTYSTRPNSKYIPIKNIIIKNKKYNYNKYLFKKMTIKGLSKITINTDSGVKTQFIYQIFRYLSNETSFFINTLVNKRNNYTASYNDLLKALKDKRYHKIHRYWRIGQSFNRDNMFFPKTKEKFLKDINEETSLSHIIKYYTYEKGSEYFNEKKFKNNYIKIY